MKEELKENSGGLSTGKEEGPKKYNGGVLCSFAFMDGSFLFEITPCPLLFPTCNLSLGDLMQFNKVHIFISSPDFSLIFRAYPAAQHLCMSD